MTYVLLREAGGIGDVVRTFPAARGLKARDASARVGYVCLAGYEGLVRLCADVDELLAVSERARRARDERPEPARFPYLRRFGRGARFVDLYCPALRHELETRGRPRLDRVEVFCRAAGVAASTPRLALPPETPRRLRGRIEAFLGRTGPLAGLAPYATHVARSWQNREGVLRLAERLRAEGFGLVFFNSWARGRPGRGELLADELGAFPAVALGWAELAAAVSLCDVLVSVDTGILHLAGALGVRTLGLFGPTSGEVVSRPYPTHESLQTHVLGACCDSPCYCLPFRGYSPAVCGAAGCALLAGLDPDEAASRALALAGPAARLER